MHLSACEGAFFSGFPFTNSDSVAHLGGFGAIPALSCAETPRPQSKLLCAQAGQELLNSDQQLSRMSDWGPSEAVCDPQGENVGEASRPTCIPHSGLDATAQHSNRVERSASCQAAARGKDALGLRTVLVDRSDRSWQLL